MANNRTIIPVPIKPKVVTSETLLDDFVNKFGHELARKLPSGTKITIVLRQPDRGDATIPAVKMYSDEPDETVLFNAMHYAFTMRKVKL